MQLRDLQHATRLAKSHGWSVDLFDPLRNPPGFAIQPCPNCGAYDAIVEQIDGQILVNCPGCDNPPAILELFYTPNGNTNPPPTIRGADALTQLDVQALLAAPPPEHEWVWDGYIERRTVTVLHGDGGTGKSILAGHLARAITTGGQCLGRPTIQGNVVIIDAENHLAEIARRLHALDFHNSPTTRFAYYRASDPILGATDRIDVDLLTHVLEVHQANVCILDSQRGVWAGDEKEAIEIRPLYRALQAMAEALDCAVIIIHHDRRMGGYSGSSDIHNAADTRLHLERPDPEKPERILHHAKARSSAELPSASYTFTFDQATGYFTFTQPREPVTEAMTILTALDDDDWRTYPEVADRAGMRQADAKMHLWQLVREGKVQTLQGPPGRSRRAIGFRLAAPLTELVPQAGRVGTSRSTGAPAHSSPDPSLPLRGEGRDEYRTPDASQPPDDIPF